jgi:hypothetical protein
MDHLVSYKTDITHLYQINMLNIILMILNRSVMDCSVSYEADITHLYQMNVQSLSIRSIINSILCKIRVGKICS